MWPNRDRSCVCVCVEQGYDCSGIQKYMQVYMQSGYLKCLI